MRKKHIKEKCKKIRIWVNDMEKKMNEKEMNDIFLKGDNEAVVNYNTNRKVLIVSGGSLDYEWAREWLADKQFDYVIAADSGLMYADKLELQVDYILGDYDSVKSDILEKYSKKIETVTYPTEKDYTDTHIAVLTAIRNGAASIAIIGATGTRYDHAMTNIFVLKEAIDKDVECAIYDACNKIYLKQAPFSIEKDRQYGDYISFVPMTDGVRLTLKGVKYPLNDYCLRQGMSICQSNEIVDEVASIYIEKGIVIVLETRD